MKKKNVFIAFVLTLFAIVAFGQDSATATFVADSIQQHEAEQLTTTLLNTTVGILDATNNSIIPGVSNTYTGALIGVVIREIIAAIFRRRKRKKAAQQ